MNLQTLTLPDKGFTKAEREWIKNVLIPAIKTVNAVQGKNVTITNSDNGQEIAASDCQPCP